MQVGAGIASVLGRQLGLSADRVKALLPVGAAAAVAAAFNTPLAAVVFSLEEITAWVVLRVLLGNHPLFQVPQYELVHPVLRQNSSRAQNQQLTAVSPTDDLV